MATKKANAKNLEKAKKAVKALFTFDLGNRRIVNKGEIIEIAEEKAQSLIERGFCEEA